MTLILVTTLEDNEDGMDGEVSLREAIRAANLNLNVNEAPAGEAGAPDTIAFDPSLSGGTLRLASELPALTGETTIDGDIDGDGRPDITITGDVNGNDLLTTDLLGNRISEIGVFGAPELADNLPVLLDARGDVTLNGLVLTGAGGDPYRSHAVYGGPDSVLTITNTALSGNESRLAVVFSYSGTTVLDTVFISEARTTAGNIWQVGGTLTATDLTITRTSGFLGAIALSNPPAVSGIPLDPDTPIASLTNLTLTDNSAADLILYAQTARRIDVNHATITGNEAGRGVFRGYTSTYIANSVISGNQNSDGGYLALYTYADSPTVTFPDPVNSVYGDDASVYFAEIDPETGGGRLRDNGGFVPTVQLRTDNANPAIDIGLATPGLAFDARGEVRFIDFDGIDNGGFTDAGAVEMRAPVLLLVTTAEDELDSSSATASVLDMGGTGDLSLREALHIANNALGFNRIGFDDTVFTGGAANVIRLALTQGTLVVTDFVEIDGDLDDDGRPDITVTGDRDGDDLITTDGLGNTITDTATNGDVADRLSDNIRVFEVSAEEARIEGLIVTGGYASGPDPEDVNGGGIVIRPDGGLTLVASSVSGNQAEEDGGGLGMDGAPGTESGTRLTLEGTTVEGNRAGVAGGGIASFFAETEIRASTVVGNTATGGTGGGINNGFGTTLLENVTLSGNTAFGAGGGLSNGFFGITTIRSSTVTGNSVVDGQAGNNAGGGINNREGLIVAGDEINIFDSIILGNTATDGPEIGGPRVTSTNTLSTGAPADVFATLDGTGGALGLNGGNVETVALRVALDNPAIDAADTLLVSDARGELRGADLEGVDNGGTDDLGAFELSPGDVPGVLSIERLDPAGTQTNADLLRFTVTFNEAVDNVDATDFEATGATTADEISVSGSGAVYTVDLGGGDLSDFEGTVGLQLTAAQDITTSAGAEPLLITEAPLSETYALDNTAPTVEQIARQIPREERTSADTLTFGVFFDGVVANVTADDFVATGTTATVTGFSALDADIGIYDITISGGDLGDLDGTVGLAFSAGQDIADAAGNALTDTTPTGSNETYMVVNSPLVSILDAVPRLEGEGNSFVTINRSFAELAPTSVELTATFQTASQSDVEATGTSTPPSTITIGPNLIGQTFAPFDSVEDNIVEPDETILLTISNPVNGVIDDATEVWTILDDDTATISVDDVTLAEGNGGTTDFVFTLSLSNPVANAVMVDFETTDGTAVSSGSATGQGDFTAQMGTATFAALATSTTVTISVNADETVELNESFTLDLSNIQAGGLESRISFSDAQGLGTITNDDSATVSIDDVSIGEGDGGTVPATFTVSLSRAVDAEVSMSFATANGTATAGGDYAANMGTVSFAVGETSKIVTVNVTGDDLAEADETFFVNLSMLEANGRAVSFSDAQGMGTIEDDDAAPNAADDTASGDEDTEISGDVRANDSDADTPTAALTVTLESDVSDGALDLQADGTFTYQPDTNFNGTDGFTYRLSDGTNSDTATVEIAVNAAEDAPEVSGSALDPVYVENAAPVPLFSTVSLDPVETDQGFSGVELEISGLLDGGLETLTFDGVALSLSDGAEATLPGGGKASVESDGANLLVTLADLGRDRDAAEALLEGLAFSISGDDPSIGERQVAIAAVIDSGGGRKSLSLASRVTVEPVNDAPVGVDDGATLAVADGGVIVDVLGNDRDAEGDPLEITALDTTGLRGSAEIFAGQIRYLTGDAFAELSAEETATEVLVYTVADDLGATATATLTLSVIGPGGGSEPGGSGDPGGPEDPDNPGGPPDPDGPGTPPVVANDPPVARDDRFEGTIVAAVTGSLLADNGSGVDGDPNGDLITVVSAAGSAVGTASALPSGASVTVLASGSFTYDPGAAFADAVPGDPVTDSFDYAISDGGGLGDTATVTILFDTAAGFEPVLGTDGDDRFELDDLDTPRRVEGGSGADSASLPLFFADATFVPIEGGFRLIPANGQPVDLLSVERFEFADATVVLDTREALTKLALIYDGAFDRMPDVPGLTFWEAVQAAGAKLDAIADAFATSDEFAAINGGLLEDEGYVRAVYRNATDREGDGPGVSFWTNAIATGALDRGDLLTAFACSDEVRELNQNAIDDGLLLLA